MRRLAEDEHLTEEFATTWRTYELDDQTRALLNYAEKLTKHPSLIDDLATNDLQKAGWSEKAIYEATCLIAFFNFSGRLEAASGLPADVVPEGSVTPEARS